MGESGQQEVQQGPWSTFFLAGEMFAVNAADVQEVMLHQELTPVPGSPAHIVGLLNLRGHIMPAVDLRRRLHFAERPQGDDPSILVLKTQDGLLSVVVDSIGDVLELAQEKWEPSPETLAQKHRRFVFGIWPMEHKIVLGLRVASLGSDEDPPTQEKR